MTKIKKSTITRKVLYSLLSATLLLSYFPNIASAAQITARKVVIGSSDAGANTTYEFTFTVPSTTVTKSASFTACTTASGACTPATGFADVNASTLTGQPTNLGDAAGWAVDTATTGVLKIKKTGNLAAPTPATPTTVSFSNVKNPTATNSTFFIRIATFSDDAYTTAIDTGVVAASTAGQIMVAANVDETLNFIINDATVDLGTLAKTITGIGTSSMVVGTNATSGYSLSYSGQTLTSGSNTINAMSSASASTTNSRQFGMNLMSNTTPAVGVSVTGSGTGIPAVNYNTQDLFMFNVSGDVIATAAAATNDNTFTASYIANIDSSTAAGVYTTILTFVVTANF